MNCPWLDDLVDLHQQTILLDAEFAALYLMCGLKTQQQSRWLTGPSSQFRHFDQPLTSIQIDQLPPALRDIFPEAKVKPQQSILDVVKHFGFLKISSQVNHALLLWAQRPEIFVLTSTIPSPLEMLNMQALGRRPVTVIIEKDKIWQPTMHKPNAIEFLIHDLEHGLHFFITPDIHLGQVRFFQLLLSAYEAGLFAQYLTDSQFVVDLHYLMADMNSHCIHMFQYLRAKMIECQCRQGTESNATNLALEKVLRHWQMDEALLESSLATTRPIDVAGLNQFFSGASP